MRGSLAAAALRERDRALAAQVLQLTDKRDGLCKDYRWMNIFQYSKK
ncbi:MAG: hypothetical protein ACREQ8_04705 [Woeseiaceae bacterium]